MLLAFRSGRYDGPSQAETDLFGGGETQATKAGRAAHKAFDEVVKQKPGWTPKPQIKKGGRWHRPDALDPKGRPVELKPNTPSGRRAGQRQIERYKRVYDSNGRVIYYDPETGELLIGLFGL